MEKVRVGDYLVIGNEGSWQIMEQFGQYRIGKKVFKKQQVAMDRALTLDRLRQRGASL